MGSFKSFLSFLTLISFLVSLSQISQAARNERGRRPEDFNFTPARNTAPPTPEAEFTPKEEGRIRELVFLYNYSYEKAENKIRRARKIKKTLLFAGVFTVTYLIVTNVMADARPALSSLNSLSNVTDRLPIRDTFLVNVQGDIFEVSRNTPKASSCRAKLSVEL